MLLLVAVTLVIGTTDSSHMVWSRYLLHLLPHGFRKKRVLYLEAIRKLSDTANETTSDDGWMDPVLMKKSLKVPPPSRFPHRG